MMEIDFREQINQFRLKIFHEGYRIDEVAINSSQYGVGTILHVSLGKSDTDGLIISASGDILPSDYGNFPHLATLRDCLHKVEQQIMRRNNQNIHTCNHVIFIDNDNTRRCTNCLGKFGMQMNITIGDN